MGFTTPTPQAAPPRNAIAPKATPMRFPIVAEPTAKRQVAMITS